MVGGIYVILEIPVSTIKYSWMDRVLHVEWI